MKSILLSIKPKYVCKILNKEKILEIRTSCPMGWKKYLDGKTNIKPKPYKVYIYCTQGKMLHDMKNESYWSGKRFALTDLKSNNIVSSSIPFINRKVFAEFTLNKVEKFTVGSLRSDDIEKLACLSHKEVIDYFYNPEELDGNHSKIGYAWHIDDLKIYDNPKELSNFKKENKCHYASYEQGCCFENCTFYDLKDCDGKYSKIYKAPQSWCYVEEIGEEI